jgi:hypothetical protein
MTDELTEYEKAVRPFVRADRWGGREVTRWPLDDPATWRRNILDSFVKRDDFVKRFAWAIPNAKALQTVALLSPIVEIGAGNGYWASLLEARGAVVHAYDDMSWTDQTGSFYTTVLKAGPAVLPYYSSSWSLFLCWPPYSTSMAFDALKRFRGTRFAYIGEGASGCNGTEAFHALLERDWTERQSVPLVQWEGLHDGLTIYERSSTRD